MSFAPLAVGCLCVLTLAIFEARLVLAHLCTRRFLAVDDSATALADVAGSARVETFAPIAATFLAGQLEVERSSASIDVRLATALRCEVDRQHVRLRRAARLTSAVLAAAAFAHVGSPLFALTVLVTVFIHDQVDAVTLGTREFQSRFLSLLLRHPETSPSPSKGSR